MSTNPLGLRGARRAAALIAWWALVVAGGAFLCPTPARLDAQATPKEPPGRRAATLAGWIQDRQGEGAVAGVRVIVTHGSPEERVAVTEVDSLGAFELMIPEGSYVVRFNRVGYKPLEKEVLLEVGVRTELTVSLVPDALDLAPIVVTVTKRTPWFMREFERRRATSIGSFVTREQIERRHPQLVSELFRTMSGVRLVADRYGQQHLLMRGSCVPQVYIDGVATYEQMSIDLSLRPEDIEAIEVYSNASIPIEYASGACGAILVWSRPPEQTRGRKGWWKTLLALGGVFGAVMLIH